MNRYLRNLALCAAILSPLAAQAETPEEKGLSIAREMDLRNSGWGDSTSTMQMVLRNRQGEESKRGVRVRTMEQSSDGDKSLMIFDEPRDVKGTVLLTYAHKTAVDDDHWLFLPSVKRVKRIAGNNKSGPFMGSEFAFEDLGIQEIEKFTYKYIKDDVFDGHETFVLERYPLEKNSGYTRQVMWIDKLEYRQRKIDYYDRKSSLLKTLVFSAYSEYLDLYWRPQKLEMVNHQTGKSTTMEFAQYQFRTGLSDRDFDQASLSAAK
ncbi:MAG: outer membrane lipoprotein-sorting protein [Longimicrobiales bacterium]